MTKHVELRQAGRTTAVPEGVTILDAALADGIAYPHGCRSGRCESCKSRLISGKVDLFDHSRLALSYEEKAQGLILACRAIPTTDAIVGWLGGDEDDPLAFTAGQYARLTFPGAPTRDYSLASGSGEREVEFHIRRVPGGATTQRIHALLKLGDPVLVEGPFGSSYLRAQRARSLSRRPFRGIGATAAQPDRHARPLRCSFGGALARRLRDRCRRQGPACRCVLYARRSIGAWASPSFSDC